jgi:hypothetical protein
MKDKNGLMIVNVDQLWYLIFPLSSGDARTQHLLAQYTTAEKINVIAMEIAQLQADLKREEVGRRKRDVEISRLRQLEIVHNAINYNRRLL